MDLVSEATEKSAPRARGGLAERGGGGVVDSDEGSGAVGGFGEESDVADVHGGVAGGLDPEKLGAFEVGELAVVGGGGEAELNAHLCEVLLGEDAGGEVGVVGKDGDVAGAKDGSEDRGAGGHAGCEDERGGAVAFTGLDLGEGLFEVRPGGVVGTGVGVRDGGWVAGCMVGSGEDRAGVDGLACFGAGERGADDLCGFAHESIVLVALLQEE